MTDEQRLTDADFLAMVNALEPNMVGMLEVIAQTVPGRDNQTIIDGLMRITCLSAMLAGVDSDDFAGNMKVTWDYYAEQMNAAARGVS